MVGDRRTPLLLRGQRLDRIHMGDRLALRLLCRQVLDELIALALHERLGFEVLEHAGRVHRVGIEQPGLGIERRMRPVLRAALGRP